MKSKIAVLALMISSLLGVGRMAHAIPLLQLYMEGGTYDVATETWVGAGTDPIRIWAIGNVEGEGGAATLGDGNIYDVKLAISYDSDLEPVAITINSSTTGGFGNFVDPSTPQAASFIRMVDDGSLPQLGGGGYLPNHGQFGEGRNWQEFALGDYTSPGDSQLVNFDENLAIPTLEIDTDAQINVYEIYVDAAQEVELHFDLYNHVMGEKKVKYRFAPFGHHTDSGDGSDVATPEPSTFALGLMALASLGLFSRRKRRRN